MRWLARRQFKSSDPAIREATLHRLSTRAGVKEIGLFAEALLDENADVRRAASRAISMIPPSIVPQCVDTLLPVLEKPDFSLRRGAVSALEALGWTPQLPRHQALCQIALGNFETIPEDEGAVEPLLNALKTGTHAIQVGAARALEHLLKKIQDPRITDALLHALKSDEINVRAAAASALGYCLDEKRIPPLLKALKDESPQVRAAAAESIGKIQSKDHLNHLAPLLKDKHFEVRQAVVTELARIDSPETLDLIISALHDPDADVRKRAVECLGKLRNPRSLGALIGALIDPESAVRHSAANVLQIMNCNWRSSKEAQDAIPRLEAALSDSEYWVREAAAKALNRIRNA